MEQAETERPLYWNKETRVKLAARLFSKSGEIPAGWTESDEREWAKLKAREAVAGKPTPSQQQQSDREQCMALFNGAPSAAEKQQILRDYHDQHFEDAVAWPWAKEMRNALAEMGLPLHSQTKLRQSGAEGAGVSGNWINLDPDTLRRRQLVLRNPRMPSKNLCNVFDQAAPRIELPRDWRAELSVDSWSKAYENRTGRNRIQKIISTDRRAGRPKSS